MDSFMNSRQEVTVTDINMPFWSMVVFMVKWAVAAIPAMLILFCAAAAATAVLTIFFSMLGAGLGSLSK